MKLCVKHLKRYFGPTKAVDDISFSFGAGQIYGFIGPNGAGKTTTMRILATLDEPTEGEVTIDDQSILDRPELARRMVGYMPDNLPTHRDLSVHEYLDFFARAYSIHNPKRDAIVEGVEQFANLMGIRDKSLNALSKGMKQRVSLARAIIHDPPLLVLDEPAAGLDPRARVELRELLRQLSQQGKAILISSHILTELAEICDGALILEHGKIVAGGSISDILSGNGQARGTTTTRVMVRSLQPVAELHKALLQLPGVEQAQVIAGAVEAQLAGGEEAAGQLLKTMVMQNLPVVEFRIRNAHLEEIFMSVTKGEVS